MRFRLLFIALLVVLFTANCGPGSSAPINIVVTTGMIADVVKFIGASHVAVTQLIASNTDPHSYVPSSADQTALQNAQIIFYNGLNLEAHMLPITASGDKSPTVVALADAIPSDKLLRSSTTDAPDPHIWQDVSLWEIVAGKIRDQLIALDGPNAADYKKNADAYLAGLQELDQYIHDQSNRIPAEQRVLVTTHHAFDYFGRAYGFTVFAPEGITTDAQPSPDDIHSVIQAVLDHHVAVVFPESTSPPDLMNAILVMAGAQGPPVDIGAPLYADALGTSDTDARVSTYDGMMRHNIDTIVTTLLGLPAE